MSVETLLAGAVPSVVGIVVAVLVGQNKAEVSAVKGRLDKLNGQLADAAAKAAEVKTYQDVHSRNWEAVERRCPILNPPPMKEVVER